jgi:hypothetical protein
MKILILALMLTGCASMQWPVDCSTTTLKTLDRRLTDAMYNMHVDGTCSNGAYDNFTECPEYHREWRRYWAARQELDACGPAGTVRS